MNTKVAASPTSLPVKTLRQIIREQTPGSWIAISLHRKSVVGLGISPEEAKLVAKAEGEAEVVLFKVPKRAFDQRHFSAGKK